MKEHEPYTAHPHDWAELMRLHQTEKLPEEKVIGQLLVWGRLQHEALLVYERKLEEQEGYIADLVARVTTLEEEKSSR